MKQLCLFVFSMSLLASGSVFAREGQSCGPGGKCPLGELCSPIDNKCYTGPKLIEIQTRFDNACIVKPQVGFISNFRPIGTIVNGQFSI